MNALSDPPALKLSDIAGRYAVAAGTVREWIVSGLKPLPDKPAVKLKARRIGDGWRVEPADLAAFLDECDRVRESAPDPSPPAQPGRKLDAHAQAVRDAARRQRAAEAARQAGLGEMGGA